MNWDLMIILLALYNCVMIPLNLAFINASAENEGILPIMITERIIDVFFILDIILNFRTTFINPNTNIEIVEPSRVAKNYVYSIRFPFDILASIPFDLFLKVEDGGSDSF